MLVRSNTKTATSLQSRRNQPANAVERWRAPNFQSIELHRGSAINSEYPRHWHDELYLCAIIEGGSELHCAGGSQVSAPGTLVLIPSGEVHADRKWDCSFRCMFIELPALRAAWEQFAGRSVSGIDFRTQMIRDARTLASFLRLYRALETPGSPLKRESALAGFLHRLVRRHSSAAMPALRNGSENFAVGRTRKFLDEHFAERISLHDLAQLTGLSPFHLHRSFCRKVGMPPHAYQLQSRITRALTLLRRGHSISDAASSVGFVDQSHFARHFKRSTGVTPGQYQLAQQECTRRSAAFALTS